MKHTQEFLEMVRMYFFNNEGYMETDEACIKYWEKHYVE